MTASEGRLTQQAGFKCTTNDPGKYKFMSIDVDKADAADIRVERSGAGQQVFGISYETTAAALRNIGINVRGICFLNVDGNAGTIAPGDYLKSDASGLGVKTTTDGNEVGAVALEDSTGSDDVILVEIRKFIHP